MPELSPIDKMSIDVVTQHLDIQMRQMVTLSTRATGLFGSSLTLTVSCCGAALLIPTPAVLAGAFSACVCLLVAMVCAFDALTVSALLPGLLPCDMWAQLNTMDCADFAADLNRKLATSVAQNDRNYRRACRRLTWAYRFAIAALPLGVVIYLVLNLLTRHG